VIAELLTEENTMPLFRRFGRPGLLSAAERTSVVGGSAILIARVAASGSRALRVRSDVGSDEQERCRACAALALLAGENPALVDQLVRLAGLFEAGELSRVEFDAAKTAVLTP
jgi:hypothetical protein